MRIASTKDDISSIFTPGMLACAFAYAALKLVGSITNGYLYPLVATTDGWIREISTLVVKQTSILEELIDPETRISYGIVQPGPEGTGDMGVLRPVDIADGRLCLDTVKKIDRAIGNSSRRTELMGDEILTIVRGATGQTVRSKVDCAGMNVTRGIAVIRHEPSLIDPDYLVGYMNSDNGKRYIADHTQGATLQQINIADLKVMPIPVPPLALQQEFADFVAQVDKLRFGAQQQIDKLEMLKKSLMQEYFE